MSHFRGAPPRAPEMAEAVRPRRQRTASSRVRTFDLETRNQIKRKRLDSLEADNWHESRAKEEEEDETKRKRVIGH